MRGWSGWRQSGWRRRCGSGNRSKISGIEIGEEVLVCLMDKGGKQGEKGRAGRRG